MNKASFINPERITDRLFGGPHFMVGWRDDDFFYSLDKAKRWRASDVAAAWNEGRNLPPLNAERNRAHDE